jgi:hypothetical protein
MFTRFLA